MTPLASPCTPPGRFRSGNACYGISVLIVSGLPGSEDRTGGPQGSDGYQCKPLVTAEQKEADVMTVIPDVFLGGLVVMMLVWVLGRYHEPQRVSRRTARREARKIQKTKHNEGGTSAPITGKAVVS